ncbi:MAG TPA: hemerythrin family protein [Rhodospirillaceae bacterium]|nr:hemerythrin family protein [Rhodospirillaceae bacterium]
MTAMEIASDGVLVLGFPEIDRDHHSIMQMVNSEWDPAREKVVARLEEIARKAIDHFEREEALMGTHLFSLFARHKKEHNQLVEDISNVIFDIKSGLDFNVEELLHWTIRWLIEHIETQDKDLAVFLLRPPAS